MTTSSRSPAWTSRIARAWTSAPSTASTRGSARCTSTPRSAWTVAPASPCAPPRPIFYEDDLPEEWSDYLRANVDFFNELGSPRRRQKTGVQDYDDPMIAALPPQNQD